MYARGSLNEWIEEWMPWLRLAERTLLTTAGFVHDDTWLFSTSLHERISVR
jgi:hypothetical protein